MKLRRTKYGALYDIVQFAWLTMLFFQLEGPASHTTSIATTTTTTMPSSATREINLALFAYLSIERVQC